MNIEHLLKAKPLSERGKLILNAAQELFLEHGFDNTSLEMIISESGGSRRNIYSEFGNKEGLFIAVVRQHISGQVETLSEIDYQASPTQALTEICTKFVEGMLSETLVALFRLVTNMVPKMPELGELIYTKGPLTGCVPLADYLKYLDEQKVISVDDYQFAAQLLIEMAKGRLHLRALLVPNLKIEKQEIDAHIEKSVALFLKAYSR